MKGRLCWVGCAFLCLATVALAQDQGEIGIGYAWLTSGGNQNAFRSQYNIQQGFFLESLQLDMRKWFAGYDRFEFKASGFGGEPYRKASFTMVDSDREWSIQLNYARRNSFFQLSSFDQGQQRDDWNATRWTGNITWGGWRAVRLRLDLRDVQTSGTTQVPFYGLGVPYVASIKLDQHVQEAGISLETMQWPVKLVFEQDVTRYTNENRAAPGNNGQSYDGTDPDVLSGLSTPGKDTATVPTTRLSLVYRGPVFEIVGQGLYRRDNFSVNNADAATTFAVNGGKVGHASFIDNLTGSADADIRQGDLRIGAAVAPWLTLRARGDYRDVDTNMSLVGQHILNLTGPGGGLTFPLDVNNSGYLNHKDTLLTGEADLHSGGFGLVVAYHDSSRDVAWKYGTDYAPSSVNRTGTGWNATASYALGRAFTVEAGYDDSTFEKYVFRTQPQTVNRLWGKVALRPAKGFEITAHASRDKAENPASVANLNQPTDSYGAAISYSADSGAFVTASYDAFKLTSDMNIYYPAGGVTTGVSSYSTNLQTPSLRFGLPIGKVVKVTGGALQVKDTGDSMPFTSDVYDLELVFAALRQADFVLFGNYWSYDLKNTSVDDYTVKRYGVTVRWRF
jgi:hypothetical protein